MVERVREFFNKPNPQGQSTLEVLDIAIHNTQKAIKRVSRTIVLLTKDNVDDNGEEIPFDENDPIVIERRTLQVQLRRLQKQREEAARATNEDPARSITNFYYVLSHMRQEFNKQDAQTKKDIIKRLVDEIKVNAISPHLYSIHVTWIRPLATGRDDVALMWRAKRVKDESWNTWTEDEDKSLHELYPTAPYMAIMQAIPNKTPGQIKKRVYQLQIKRDYWHIEDNKRFHRNVCYNDLLAVSQFTESEEQRAWLWSQVNRMSEETKVGELTVLWFLPIDAISFSKNPCVTDVNEDELSLRR